MGSTICPVYLSCSMIVSVVFILTVYWESEWNFKQKVSQDLGFQIGVDKGENFLVFTPCQLLHSYRRFGEACSFHIQGWSSPWGLKVNTASHLSRLSSSYLSWNSLLPSSTMCLCWNILRRHKMCIYFKRFHWKYKFSVIYMKYNLHQ